MAAKKHVFIINPNAGRTDATQNILQQLKKYDQTIDYEVYVTKAAGDGTLYVREWCKNHPDENARFYACGGDGTINEVVSGIYGFKNVEMTCYPSGSGNDFIKYYGKKDDFLNIDALITGEPYDVDLMKVGDRFSLNVCNFGFDAMVAKTMIDVKRRKIIGGKRAYLTGIIKALFTSRVNHCYVTVDGKTINQDKMLLCTLSNGRFVGGSFECGPKSLNDDGLIDVCLFKPISLFLFARLSKSYVNGTQFENKRFDKIMSYCRGKVVEMTSKKPFLVSIDGEILKDSYFRVEIIDKAIRFIAPRLAAIPIKK